MLSTFFLNAEINQYMIKGIFRSFQDGAKSLEQFFLKFIAQKYISVSLISHYI